MPELSRTLHHHLDRQAVLRFDRAVRLQVDQGALWLTVDGEPDDLQLEPGEVFEHDGHARLVATPLGGPADVSSRELPTPPARWHAWFAPLLSRYSVGRA